MKRVQHPAQHAIIVLRAWLIMVAIFMTLNASVALAYLLSPEIKVAPFYFFALTALLWAKWVYRLRVVITMSSLLIVGTFMRGLEVVFFATDFPINKRLTDLSLWWFFAGTTLAFAILNLLVTSRLQAEELMCGHQESDSDYVGY